MPITIPDEAYAVLQSLIRLSEADFNSLLEALKKARPAVSPDSFCENVAALMPKADSAIIENIISELFAMDLVRDDKDFSIDEFVKLVSERLEATKSDQFTFNENDRHTFEERLTKIFGARKTLGISSKALDLLTDQDRVFFSSKIITDVRPVFNDEGSAVEASVIVHNLRIHYGQDNDHKDFYVTLDTGDIQKLRSVLDRAEIKAEYLKTLLESSGVSYLDAKE